MFTYSGTKRWQIQEYVNRNVFKGSDENGKIVWHCIDLREGDTFHHNTYNEAANEFVRLWDFLDFDEKNNA